LKAASAISLLILIDTFLRFARNSFSKRAGTHFLFSKELCANPGKSSINGKKGNENSKENSTLPAVLKRVM
jgi:hypothetical protein